MKPFLVLAVVDEVPTPGCQTIARMDSVFLSLAVESNLGGYWALVVLNIWIAILRVKDAAPEVARLVVLTSIDSNAESIGRNARLLKESIWTQSRSRA